MEKKPSQAKMVPATVKRGDHYLIGFTVEMEKLPSLFVPRMMKHRVTSKYTPHQGKREMARRAARLALTPRP